MGRRWDRYVREEVVGMTKVKKRLTLMVAFAVGLAGMLLVTDAAGASTGNIISQADGDVLVGTDGDDFFVVAHAGVTVWPNGGFDAVRADEGASALLVRGDAMFGTLEPTLGGGLYVVIRDGDAVVYGTTGRDVVKNYSAIPGFGTGEAAAVELYGRGGNDLLSTYVPCWDGDADDKVAPDAVCVAPPDGTLLTGGPGNDQVTLDEVAMDGDSTLLQADSTTLLQADSTTLLQAQVTRAWVVLKGGAGRDRLVAKHHRTVVYAGRGYDVCRVVRGVKHYGCEKVVRLG
jgi:hypothetical protein